MDKEPLQYDLIIAFLVALLFECQVPVQDFSNAITAKYMSDKVSISYCSSDLFNITMHIIDALQYLSCAH